jgi:hypothetical protein
MCRFLWTSRFHEGGCGVWLENRCHAISLRRIFELCNGAIFLKNGALLHRRFRGLSQHHHVQAPLRKSGAQVAELTVELNIEYDTLRIGGSTLRTTPESARRLESVHVITFGARVAELPR